MKSAKSALTLLTASVLFVLFSFTFSSCKDCGKKATNPAGRDEETNNADSTNNADGKAVGSGGGNTANNTNSASNPVVPDPNKGASVVDSGGGDTTNNADGKVVGKGSDGKAVNKEPDRKVGDKDKQHKLTETPSSTTDGNSKATDNSKGDNPQQQQQQEAERRRQEAERRRQGGGGNASKDRAVEAADKKASNAKTKTKAASPQPSSSTGGGSNTSTGEGGGSSKGGGSRSGPGEGGSSGSSTGGGKGSSSSSTTGADRGTGGDASGTSSDSTSTMATGAGEGPGAAEAKKYGDKGSDEGCRNETQVPPKEGFASLSSTASLHSFEVTGESGGTDVASPAVIGGDPSVAGTAVEGAGEGTGTAPGHPSASPTLPTVIGGDPSASAGVVASVLGPSPSALLSCSSSSSSYSSSSSSPSSSSSSSSSPIEPPPAQSNEASAVKGAGKGTGTASGHPSASKQLQKPKKALGTGTASGHPSASAGVVGSVPGPSPSALLSCSSSSSSYSSSSSSPSSSSSSSSSPKDNQQQQQQQQKDVDRRQELLNGLVDKIRDVFRGCDDKELRDKNYIYDTECVNMDDACEFLKAWVEAGKVYELMDDVREFLKAWVEAGKVLEENADTYLSMSHYELKGNVPGRVRGMCADRVVYASQLYKKYIMHININFNHKDIVECKKSASGRLSDHSSMQAVPNAFEAVISGVRDGIKNHRWKGKRMEKMQEFIRSWDAYCAVRDEADRQWEELLAAENACQAAISS